MCSNTRENLNCHFLFFYKNILYSSIISFFTIVKLMMVVRWHQNVFEWNIFITYYKTWSFCHLYLLINFLNHRYAIFIIYTGCVKKRGPPMRNLIDIFRFVLFQSQSKKVCSCTCTNVSFIKNVSYKKNAVFMWFKKVDAKCVTSSPTSCNRFKTI